MSGKTLYRVKYTKDGWPYCGPHIRKNHPTNDEDYQEHSGHTLILNPSIDRIERGMMIEWGKKSEGTLVEEVDVINERVLVWNNIDGTAEYKKWIPINQINHVKKIGTYEYTLNLIRSFDGAMLGLAKKQEEFLK